MSNEKIVKDYASMLIDDLVDCANEADELIKFQCELCEWISIENSAYSYCSRIEKEGLNFVMSNNDKKLDEFLGEYIEEMTKTLEHLKATRSYFHCTANQ